MPYKSILVHVDDSHRALERIRIAAELALAENAHLVGATATGLSRFVYREGTVLDDPRLASHLDVLREEVSRALPIFESTVQRVGVPSFETRIADDEAADAMVLLSRYSDLVVIGQPDPNQLLLGAKRDFPGYVVLNTGRPVLIVPHTGHFEHVGTRVLIAWNGSVEAARAIANAMPFLKRADMVRLVILDPASLAHLHGEELGAEMVCHLERHEIKAAVIVQDTALRDVGPVLLRHAMDHQADLLVLGAYGHSRFREAVLGGVTHTILDKMTVPVLMSH